MQPGVRPAGAVAAAKKAGLFVSRTKNDCKVMEATLFDFPKLEITNKIRLIELFGGIGSQAMALRDIGANFEHYRLVEFDKYAVASYNAIHGTSFETTDIRNVHGADLGIVERETFTYIMTYSFPCTDLSVAGKMQGMSKAEWESGNSTRSGLLWEVERILKELPADELPQVLLMENVPQVHAEQNKGDFEAWLAFLRSRGYFNFYQDLNAKDYGIPQNRDRCFCVSILSPEFIDYEFPEPVKLEKVMRDYLEDQVDEKYYIKSEKADKLIAELIERGELPTEQTCSQLTSVSREQEKLKSVHVLQQDMTQESVNINSKEAAYLNYRRIEEVNCKVAKTLCARDYKGFGTGWDTMNGVIGCIKP